MRILRPLLLAFLAACLAACDPSRPAAIANARAQLVGTWLSESDEGGIRTRTVIALAGSGEFDEFEKTDDGKGSIREMQTGGEWSFDGTNLQRKYTRKQRQALPLNHFASTSYAIHWKGADSFFGVDTLWHRTISFSRANNGVRP
ncbi:hypothetical protein [Variovorax rhizosphaerae]|uniref:Lipocalin-like domain-containing protein n=1 Tax=Variovorax rhizosphaerae TaxID=1836200 RepID=A0ABU8WTT3_9BURK